MPTCERDALFLRMAELLQDFAFRAELTPENYPSIGGWLDIKAPVDAEVGRIRTEAEGG